MSKGSELARYTLDGGQEIAITDADVRTVLCDNPNVTDKEVRLFLELCKAQRLNPFTREAYLIKYGTFPATIVTGKEVFTKRAYRNPRFRGMKAGVTVINRDGALERREGSLVGGQTERLVGGWCSVLVEGYEVPVFDEVSLAAYTTGKSRWTKDPGGMIRKVAIVHALREAFPDEFAGLYDASEMEASMAEGERGRSRFDEPEGGWAAEAAPEAFGGAAWAEEAVAEQVYEEPAPATAQGTF